MKTRQFSRKASRLLGCRGKRLLALGNPSLEGLERGLSLRNEHLARKRRCHRCSGLPHFIHAVRTADDAVARNESRYSVQRSGIESIMAFGHIHGTYQSLRRRTEGILHLDDIKKPRHAGLRRHRRRTLRVKADYAGASCIALHKSIYSRSGGGHILDNDRIKPTAQRRLDRGAVFRRCIKTVRKRTEHRSLGKIELPLEKGLRTCRERCGCILSIVQIVQLCLFGGGLRLHLAEIGAKLLNLVPERLRLRGFRRDRPGKLAFSALRRLKTRHDVGKVRIRHRNGLLQLRRF